jgi:hypothetical protein
LLCFLGLLRAQIVLTIEGEVFSFLTMGWGSEREGCCRDMDYLESAPGRERWKDVAWEMIPGQEWGVTEWNNCPRASERPRISDLLSPLSEAETFEELPFFQQPHFRKSFASPLHFELTTPKIASNSDST